jgi:hypothetical protein
MKYAANQELAQRLTGTALKEFQQGVGGDIAAMSKTLQTAPDAVTTLTQSAYTADEYITKLGKGAERSMNAFSGIARFNATNDFLLPFNEMGTAASRFAKDTSEQQKERARAEQELQEKGLDPATKSQVEMRIEQMKTRDSFQSLINKGINPVTAGMSKLAGGIESVVDKLPGTTTTTGTQIGGSSGGGSPGVVPGKSVTIGGQTRTGGDRNWRNNNPGNIEYGPFAIKYGATGSDGRFAIFPTEEQGRMAQDALLKSKNYASLSLADAIKRYAPSNENDPKSYANQIMKSTGIDTSKTYASLTPDEQGKVLDAMKRIEGGRAGTISGPAGGYTSQLSNVNPGSSLPPRETANATAGSAGGNQSDEIQQRLAEALEKSNRLNQEIADNTKKTAAYAGS